MSRNCCPYLPQNRNFVVACVTVDCRTRCATLAVFLFLPFLAVLYVKVACVYAAARSWRTKRRTSWVSGRRRPRPPADTTVLLEVDLPALTRHLRLSSVSRMPRPASSRHGETVRSCSSSIRPPLTLWTLHARPRYAVPAKRHCADHRRCSKTRRMKACRLDRAWIGPSRLPTSFSSRWSTTTTVCVSVDALTRVRRPAPFVKRTV